jgi:hypothetical protein
MMYTTFSKFSYVSQVCHMGAICQLCMLYGRQMVPYGSRMRPMGAICEVCVPCGSCVCRIEAIREPDHAIWKQLAPFGSTKWWLQAPYKRQMVPYGSHMYCVGTLWDPSAPCWHHVCQWEPRGSQMVPCGRQLAPCGSRMHFMGAIWK